MLNNDNDLKPAYAFAYVTEPQDIKEEEEVDLSPTVFKWFWVVASVVSSIAANRYKKRAEEKARREMAAATSEAQASQQKYIDARNEGEQQVRAQEAETARQTEAQRVTQEESDAILAQARTDTQTAENQARADVSEATRQSQLSMASAEAQAEQQLAQQAQEEDTGSTVGSPGVSYTPVRQQSSLGIGGTQEPEEGTESTSGLTI